MFNSSKILKHYDHGSYIPDGVKESNIYGKFQLTQNVDGENYFISEHKVNNKNIKKWKEFL